MSNNNSGQPTVLADNSNANPASSLFFVAKYTGRTVAIRRNPDFAATIKSVQRVFPALQLLHPSCIHISAMFQEFGDILIELHDEIWPEVLPRLVFVDVSTSDDTQQEVTDPVRRQVKQTVQSIPDLLNARPEPTAVNLKPMVVKPEPMVVHVQDTHGHVGELFLPLFSTSTIRQMKDSIVKHHDKLPRNLFLSYGVHTGLENHRQLHEYGITNESTVLLTTEFKIYLVGPKSPRLPVNIVTFASISALILLYLNLIEGEGDPSSSKYYDGGECLGLIVSCGGETLDESQKLGSFNYFAPECEVLINEVGLSEMSSYATYRETVVLSVYRESPTEEDYSDMSYDSPLFSFRVFSKSTILDLKVLASNIYLNKDQTSRKVRNFELILNNPSQFRYTSIWNDVQSEGWDESSIVRLRDHPN